jgi:lipid II:glycine glycyltransferase (peptidoglycan interpeptide bridge formation enzyme)
VSHALARLSLQDPRWQAFVSSRLETSPLQLPAWASFLAETYGFTSFVLAAEEDGQIVCGLPVIETRLPLRKKRWISLPFSDEVEPLGLVPSWLPEALDDMRRDAGAASLEIRAPLPDSRTWTPGYVHRVSLAQGLDAVTRSFRSSVRQGIRVAAREGVTVRQGRADSDLAETFYSLHVRTRRRLGVPVQTRRYFRLLWRRLIEPGHGFVLVAERDAAPVAAAVFLQSRGVVLYKYGASDDRHWQSRPNNALFEAAIARAVAQGARTFDWGRTDFADDGLRRFKSNWGSEERELTYSALGSLATATGGSAQGSLSRAVIRRSPAVVSRLAGALLYRYAA